MGSWEENVLGHMYDSAVVDSDERLYDYDDDDEDL